MFETTTTIKEHTNNHPPDVFESLAQITLDSRIDCSRREYLKCNDCDMLFKSKADVEMNIKRVRYYGEYLNLYTCEECGFKGGNIIAI